MSDEELDPCSSLGKSTSIRTTILKEVTNNKNPLAATTTKETGTIVDSSDRISSLKYGVVKKVNTTVIPRTQTQAPSHSIPLTRHHPKPASSLESRAVILKGSSTFLANKSQSNIAVSTTDTSTSTASHASYSSAISATNQCTLSAGLATLTLSSSEITLHQDHVSMNVNSLSRIGATVNVPGAPKAPAATRRRSQVPVMIRTTQKFTIKKQPSGIMKPQAGKQYMSMDQAGGKDHQQPQTRDLEITFLKYDHPVSMTAIHNDDGDNDPMLAPDYQASIFAYKREMEVKLLPDPGYMSRQSDLTWHYRAQLVDWLAQMHSRFNLLQETIHLCINYVDRFLSKIVIPVDQLQLAGTVALLLASKYEETQSPAIEDLISLGGNVYTPTRVRQAELEMLRALNYDMGAPGPMSFLRRISRADNYDVDIRTLAKYLLDVTLCDHRFIGLPSSMIAAICYRASMRLLFRGEWTSEHKSYSEYSEIMLNSGVNVLLVLLEDPHETHPTIFVKYQDERYLGASDYVMSLGTAQLRALRR
ncbi:cyclin-like protein [Mortierella sp. GBAus27b]|nr:cyclin-like protein [Mortierella sp. GBAus27b]